MSKKKVVAQKEKGTFVPRSHARPIIKLPKEVKILMASCGSKEERNSFKNAVLDAIYAVSQQSRFSGKREAADTVAA